MKFIFILLLACFPWKNFLEAQEGTITGSFKNTQITIQDSVVLVSTLGAPYEYAILQNDVLLTSSPLIYHIEEDTTSLASLQPIEGLNVLPNPVMDVMVIQRKDVSEDLHVNFVDSRGEMIRKLIWTSGVETLQPSLQSFASGIYFISITNTQGTKGNHYKIIKQ